MSKNYTAQDIEVLEGLTPVQKRPGMYTDTANPNHLVQEVIDNAIDEAQNGHANEISITIKSDGSIEVEDNGRGIPVDLHKKSNKSALEVIFTSLHSGAKFSNAQYAYAGGLHGVGISVVNALSEWLEVVVHREGNQYKLLFKHGVPTSPIKQSKAKDKKQHGTYIRFKPEAKYFDSVSLDYQALLQLLKAKAVLCNTVKITYTNKINQEKIVYFYPDGFTSYLKTIPMTRSCVHGKPICDTTKDATHSSVATWALLFSPEDEILQESYVNLIPTPEHGTHVAAFRTGIVQALKEFSEVRNCVPKHIKLSGEDILQHASFILSLKITNPQFAGQTKRKLSSKESVSFLTSMVSGQLSVWLNTHIAFGEAIIALAVEVAEERARAASRQAKKKSSAGVKLPGKLVDCTDPVGSGTELFLVEGDSAGGSAKQARDRKTQAILPLRGKILNTWEVSASVACASSEVANIATAIGVEPNAKTCSGLRYDKICILADADSDGAHIATLLCALFVKHFPILVESGKIFVAQPPLFRIDLGNQVHYAITEKDKDSYIQQLTPSAQKRVSVQRFKGLGEMNPEQLRETTLDPQTRCLIQLRMGEANKTTKMMSLLLAKQKSAERRKWLEEKGNSVAIN
ncbi:MAG: DNA topoisomerase IV subunit B [Methylacidiphilales bacterium]|nr:DNA topoisomerase IV subunit B [Candidatus Methylacidiphilales bacterium]